MNWATEALPLLRAVARAIDANDGEHVNAEMVNAQLDEPLAEERLDRRLGQLLKGDLIEGPTVDQRAAPVFISLTVRGREQVSGWPGQGHGSGDVSISGSTIGSLAFRDINISNVDVASFFDVWEQKIEALDVPEDHKREARKKLGIAKEVVTGAAGSAGVRALSRCSSDDPRRHLVHGRQRARDPPLAGGARQPRDAGAPAQRVRHRPGSSAGSRSTTSRRRLGADLPTLARSQRRDRRLAGCIH